MKLTIRDNQIETLVNALLTAANVINDLQDGSEESKQDLAELDELIESLEEQMENQ
jgi:peptidoglycan hydrolase CwlO-like protein